MTSTVWGEGFFSPNTGIKKITGSDLVFLCRPLDDVEGSGWGRPLQDEQGNTLPLGTLDGVNQIKGLRKINNSWSVANTPGNQVFGNIDWRGPVLYTTEDGVDIRMSVTWNGPQMRYFRDPEVDYTEDKYKEVYYRGKYVAVAPMPVLGAGAKQIDDVWHLFVLCKDGTGDMLIRYVMNLDGWSEAELTQEIISGLSSQYHETANPIGYSVEFQIPRQSKQGTPGHEIDEEAKEATTPWFFNESCTAAVCMRESTSTYVEKPYGTETYTEDGLNKYFMQIGGVGGSHYFEFGGNIARPYWIEKHEYNKHIVNATDDLWCSNTCGDVDTDPEADQKEDGLNLYDNQNAPCFDSQDPEYPCPDELMPHNYVRFKLIQSMYAKGAQVVATDFDGDIQVTASIDLELLRTHKQEFNWGVDCDSTRSQPFLGAKHVAGSCLGNGVIDCAASTSKNDGKPACNNAPNEPPYFLNGSVAPWIGGDGRYTLKFKNSDGRKEFTIYFDFYGTKYQKENNGEQRDAWDVKFEYHGYIKRFPHFMDLRHPFIMVYTELNSDEWITSSSQNIWRYNAPNAKLDTQIFQKEAYSIDTDDATYITNDVVHNSTLDGELMGYNWVGNGTAKPVVGGPDWPFSADQTYDHAADDGTYSYTTRFIHDVWHEGLDTRTPDYAKLQPKYDQYYTVGGITANKWQSWWSFFNNNHYDDILGVTVQLNTVHGGMARTETDWIFSYAKPKNSSEDYTDYDTSYINKLNGGTLPAAIENTATLSYPIGVY